MFNSPRLRHLKKIIRMVTCIVTKFSKANLLLPPLLLGLSHTHILQLEKMEMGWLSSNTLRVYIAQGRPVRTFARPQTTSKVIQFGDHRSAAHNHSMGLSITVSPFTHLRHCQRLSHWI